MDMIIGVLMLVLTYVTFAKLPTPGVLLVWGFAAMFILLNLMGSIGDSVVYLMMILLVITLMISAVLDKNYGGENS